MEGACGAERHCAEMRQDTVNYPVHIKNFNLVQLRQLCKELRSDIIHTVSKTGGERVAWGGPRLHSFLRVLRVLTCASLLLRVCSLVLNGVQRIGEGLRWCSARARCVRYCAVGC